jgi:acyl-CoA thioester hydrolase
MEEFNGVRFRISYRVFVEGENAPVAFGESEHCFADDNLHPIRIEKRHPQILNKIQAIVREQC